MVISTSIVVLILTVIHSRMAVVSVTLIPIMIDRLVVQQAERCLEQVGDAYPLKSVQRGDRVVQWWGERVDAAVDYLEVVAEAALGLAARERMRLRGAARHDASKKAMQVV